MRRVLWLTTILHEKNQVEVVHFVGGAKLACIPEASAIDQPRHGPAVQNFSDKFYAAFLCSSGCKKEPFSASVFSSSTIMG